LYVEALMAARALARRTTLYVPYGNRTVKVFVAWGEGAHEWSEDKYSIHSPVYYFGFQ
jgi:hypothetical protein